MDVHRILVNLTNTKHPAVISCDGNGYTIDCVVAGTTVGCPSCPIENGKWFFEVLLCGHASEVVVGWSNDGGNSIHLSFSEREAKCIVLRDGQSSHPWKLEDNVSIVAIGTAIDMENKIVVFYLKDQQGNSSLLFSLRHS